MQRQRLTSWIVGTVMLCAAAGAWLGHDVGDGRAGYVALMSATCGVIGSFLPGAVLWLRTRLRHGKRVHRDAA